MVSNADAEAWSQNLSMPVDDDLSLGNTMQSKIMKRVVQDERLAAYYVIARARAALRWTGVLIIYAPANARQ
jgi:hypothetical protein